MERKIGEEFQFDDAKLEVVKAHVDVYGNSYCEGCYFLHSNSKCCSAFKEKIGYCSEKRTDKIPVIFKKVDAPEQPATDEPKSFKNDREDGKPMWELLPLPDLEDVVKVYTFGAQKYGPNTWRGLENAMDRYKAAMLRHLVQFDKGEEFDEESGLPALAHMAWNALAMLAVWHDKNKKELDKTI
ncbi:hypothetical protein EVA_15845, partial [gut metagenome]